MIEKNIYKLVNVVFCIVMDIIIICVCILISKIKCYIEFSPISDIFCRRNLKVGSDAWDGAFVLVIFMWIIECKFASFIHFVNN